MAGSELKPRLKPALQEFLAGESAGGLLLMAAAALALIVANSPLAAAYFALLHAQLGPLSVELWINDALMALFFLLVGLEIKREMLVGELSSWSRRLLPGTAALGGMAVPALIYLAFNLGHPETLRGWAVPSATDIAFSLAVLSLLGSRVPPSLKVFLAALAIIDDLGAVLIIALFYTNGLSLPDLAAAALVATALVVLNRRGVTVLWPYLLLGVALWIFIFRSGVHATLAGVVLALTIPLKPRDAAANAHAPLQRLEHLLHGPVAFLIVPLFGFVNAGVAFAGMTPAALLDPLTLGVAIGLAAGKLIGVGGAVTLAVRSGIAKLPAQASWGQVIGVALLCGIGFTMSLFIGLLAFADPHRQDELKLGILAGSFIAGSAGYAVLRLTSPERPG